MKIERLTCKLGHRQIRRLMFFGRLYERPCSGEYWKPYKWRRVDTKD